MLFSRYQTLPGAGKRILVVDDSAPNRRMLCRLFDRLGFATETAENGALAVERVSRDMPTPAFDAIFMDNEMYVMDGLTATRKLRELGVRTPIIGFTGCALKDDVDAFRAAGVDDVITKPLQTKKLHEVLFRFVGVKISTS